VLSGVASQGKTWKEALLETLPKRKGAVDKTEETDSPHISETETKTHEPEEGQDASDT